VAHAWPTLAPLVRRDPDMAAGRLAERLRVLHDAEGYEVTVIFDGRGAKMETAPTQNPGELCVLYSPTGSSADALIEQIVYRAPDATLFTVASRDNMIRAAVMASGARTITPDELLEWVQKAERRQSQALRERTRKHDRGFGNRLFG
jgi:hypothetical protein